MHQCARGSWNTFEAELTLFPPHAWFCSGVLCRSARHQHPFSCSSQVAKAFMLLPLPQPLPWPVHHQIYACSPLMDTLPSPVHVADIYRSLKISAVSSPSVWFFPTSPELVHLLDPFCTEALVMLQVVVSFHVGGWFCVIGTDPLIIPLLPWWWTADF